MEIPEVKHGKDFRANTDPSAQYEQSEHDTYVTVRIFNSKTQKYQQKRFRQITKILDPDGKQVIPRRKVEGNDVTKTGRKALGRLKEGSYKFYRGKTIWVIVR